MFLGQPTRTAGQLFIYFLFDFLSVYSVTQCYPMFVAWLGTFDDALSFSGLAILIMLSYVGYPISKIHLIDDAP